MTKPLSHAAQAVLDAATAPTGDFCLENVNEIAAAALRKAAGYLFPNDTAKQCYLRLLAIAAELEGGND
jgi:hypothetical protein